MASALHPRPVLLLLLGMLILRASLKHTLPPSISGIVPPSALALMSHLTVAVGGKTGQTGCGDEEVHRPGDRIRARGEAARELAEEAGPRAAGGHWSPRPWPHWLFAIWSHMSPTLHVAE